MIRSIIITRRFFTTDELRLALLRRLQHLSEKRGTLESGTVLGRFARQSLSSLTSEQLGCYEKLLQENDVDLFNYLSDVRPSPDYIAQNPVYKLVKASISKA